MKTIQQPEHHNRIEIDLQDKKQRLALRWLQLGTDREQATNLSSVVGAVLFYEDGRAVGTNGVHAHIIPEFQKELKGTSLAINEGKLLLKTKDTKTFGIPIYIYHQPNIDQVDPSQQLQPNATITVPIQQLREALEMPTDSPYIRLEIYPGNSAPLIVRDIEEKGRYALISPVHLPA